MFEKIRATQWTKTSKNSRANKGQNYLSGFGLALVSENECNINTKMTPRSGGSLNQDTDLCICNHDLLTLSNLVNFLVHTHVSFMQLQIDFV